MRPTIFAIAFAASMLGAECNPPVITPNLPVSDGGSPPVSDAGPDALAPTCENACAVLFANHCGEAEQTDGGLSCVELCLTTPAYAGLPVACVARAGSVAELRACRVCR